MASDTARNRDGNALKASAIVQLTNATAQCNGAIQHSKVGGWCQDGNDDDYPGFSNALLTTPSSAIPEREGR
jgi:hypothetical protein